MRDHMPGFTAEASLNKTEHHYRGLDYSGSAMDGGTVFPQLGTRYCMCDAGGNNCYCWIQLPWGGGSPIFEK